MESNKIEKAAALLLEDPELVSVWVEVITAGGTKIQVEFKKPVGQIKE